MTFNANGGSGTMSNQVANVPTALTTNAFTRGQGTRSAAGTRLLTARALPTPNSATYSFAADLTLYAQWTQGTNTVVSAATPSNGTPSAGQQIVVSINIDMSGDSGAALGSFTGSLTWDPNILTYNTNGGLLGGFTGAINTGNVGTGTIAFNGANTTGTTGNTVVFQITFDVVGSGTSALDLAYSAMAAATSFTNLLPILTVNDGSVTALANHTVTFNANGGSGTMSNQVANVPTALTANAFTRTGYTFSGWNTAANGTGTAYANGATYSFAADLTLYAQWTALPNYTVTFNANGGSGTMSNQVANVPTALTANTFTRRGTRSAAGTRLLTAQAPPTRTVRPTPLRQTSRCMPSGRRCRTTR